MELKETAPNLRNQITLESLEKIQEFDPVSLIHLMAPAALLVIAAEKDSLIPLNVVKGVYERTIEPERADSSPNQALRYISSYTSMAIELHNLES